MAKGRTGELLVEAQSRRSGIGAFNVITLEHAEGIVAGAERSEQPVILQVSENTVRFHGRLGPLAHACLDLASAATVRVAVHLDHATSEALCDEAVALGLSSLMFDASALAYEANVAATRAVVDRAHVAGVDVEAELGEVGGKDGVHAPHVRTDPGEARRFVAETGVDALAVAVGSSHAMTEKSAVIDLELIARLRDAVPVPLVLHGSSGVSDNDLGAAVQAGIVKVNLGTQLNQAFTGALREVLGASGAADPRPALKNARAAVADAVAHITELLSRPERVASRS